MPPKTKTHNSETKPPFDHVEKDISTTEKEIIEMIWDVLNREEELTEHNQWPCDNALPLRKYIIPAHDPSAGPMPIGSAYFLRKYPRRNNTAHRVDRDAKNMS